MIIVYCSFRCIESDSIHFTKHVCVLHLLVHVNYKALPIMSKVVKGLPKIQINHEGVCKGCAQGKNTKNTFPSNTSKAKWILDIVHSNVCSPMSATSLSGRVYYVYFIDEYSHNNWIYFLKSKEKVFGKFK